MAAPVHPYSEYGTALRTLRNGRNWLGVLLFLCIATQMVGFGLLRYTARPYINRTPTALPPPQMNLDLLQSYIQKFWAENTGNSSHVAPRVTPTPAADENDSFAYETQESRRLNIRTVWSTTLKIAVPLTQLLGLVAAASQTLLIFITLLLILIAQAPGVAHVTKSLNWAVVLLFMMFPWQHIAREFPVPGVLYSFDELLRSLTPYVVPDRPITGFARAVFYARFILWPIVTLLILLITAERFRAGLRLAVGHPLQGIMQPRIPTPHLAGTPLIRTVVEKRTV